MLATLFVTGCAHGRVVATPARAPALIIDSPRPDTLVLEPEIDVSGHFATYDRRAWVYVDGTAAEVKGDRFVARRVPLREGKTRVFVELSDARGTKARVELPLVVETADRPRQSSLCRPAVGCLRFEERGRPRRDAAGHITNAVVVLPAFGFDERMDELWPDLVGPGRALDSRERYILGVVGAPHAAGNLPSPDAILALLDELFRDRALDRGAVIVGASSYGSELALRALARGMSTGPLLVCGGHDRPSQEPTMQAVQATLKRIVTQSPSAAWLAIARVIVPPSYGAGYLEDLAHAPAHGLEAEAKAHGLAAALVDELAAHFATSLPIEALQRRIDSAFELEQTPLVYPHAAIAGRHIVLVANKDDRLVSVNRIRALGLRLTLAGARVTMQELSDPLGHSVFFHRVPLELETAVRSLFTAAP